MALPPGYEIEVVRGRIDAETGEALVRFWTAHGALAEHDARRRVDDVVCVLLDESGAIAGVNSVYREKVALIGHRSFWMYRAFVPGAGDDTQAAMIAAAYDALQRAFAGSDQQTPIGLCVLLTDRGMIERHPEAVWPDLEMIYAGYTPEGAQVRIRYFDGARI